MKNSMLKLVLPLALMLLFVPRTAGAHCDTMDGPVVKDAKAAIARNDVAIVLKWVGKDHEQEVRQAFKKTLEVRKGGEAARELADMYFFETLVRLHRAGEGEPYTGLKPAGTPIEPVVRKADMSIAQGSVEDLAQHLSLAAKEEIAKRFRRVVEAKKNAGMTVESGREYVEAYVEFVHYVEQLQQLAEGQLPSHSPGGDSRE